MAELVSVWVGGAVGQEYAVAVEVVVACRVSALITSVLPYLLAGALAGAAHALVDEVPDESSLVVGVLAYEFPVLLEASSTVSHGVCILALDEGTRVASLAVLLTCAVVTVHRAEHLCLALLSHLLILYHT